MSEPTSLRLRPFHFAKDTFAFANELVWQYRLDPAAGTMSTFRSDPPPTYYHRCFVMVRSARQFYYHARFAPEEPAVEAPSYARLIAEVLKRSPLRPSPESERVVIPGYDGLRALSVAHESTLKSLCGGPWEGYFLRSHWRMVFPVWPWQQERMAQQLVRALDERPAPIVHLFRFPHITINHGIVLYARTETDREIRFEAYDPNIPGHPTTLTYEHALRTFVYPRAHYWAGGGLNVLEIFRGGLY